MSLDALELSNELTSLDTAVTAVIIDRMVIDSEKVISWAAQGTTEGRKTFEAYIEEIRIRVTQTSENLVRYQSAASHTQNDVLRQRVLALQSRISKASSHLNTLEQRCYHFHYLKIGRRSA